MKLGVYKRKEVRGTQTLEPEKLIKHEHFNPITLANDIGLIKLKESYQKHGKLVNNISTMHYYPNIWVNLTKHFSRK